MTVNIYDKERLYNPEVKIHYLDDYEGDDSTKLIIYNLFIRTAPFEKSKRTDLYKMTDEQLSDVLKGLNVPSESTMEAYFGHINGYLKWASIDYGGSKFPRFGGIPFSQISHKFVNDLKKIYYTQQELFELYARFNSKIDIFLVQAVFEGISGKNYSELSNLKLDDFYKEDDNYFVNLYNTAEGKERLKFKVSEFLYGLAEEIDEYLTYHSPKGSKTKLINSSYLLKPASNRQSMIPDDTPLDKDRIGDRARAIKEYLDYKSTTLANFRYSGMMDYLYHMIQNREPNNEGVIIVTNEDISQIAERFDYGINIHSVTLKPVVNYKYVKSRIYKEFFNKHYCKIEFE